MSKEGDPNMKTLLSLLASVTSGGLVHTVDIHEP